MTEQTPVENGTDVNVSVTTQTPETEPVAEVPTGVEVAPDVDSVEVDAADSEVDSDGEGEGDDDQELDSDGDSGDSSNEEDDE